MTVNIEGKFWVWVLIKLLRQPPHMPLLSCSFVSAHRLRGHLLVQCIWHSTGAGMLITRRLLLLLLLLPVRTIERSIDIDRPRFQHAFMYTGRTSLITPVSNNI